MKKIIEIMDYENIKRKIKIDDFENVVKLNIKVVAGDEILQIIRKDYSEESYDSCDFRLRDFLDNCYTIYDITKNIDYLKKWKKRTDSYDDSWK